MSSIEQIMRLSLEERRRLYTAKDISKIVIDGNVFENYGAYSFLWEKSYVKSPTRSSSGVIDNLNTHSTFITGHLKIDFSLISIDDYRRLLKLMYSKNEFEVSCYDIVYDKIVKLNMYFSTDSMPKLYTLSRQMQALPEDEWSSWVELIGVQEYTIELVGTNTNFDGVEIIYHKNPPLGSNLQDETIKQTDISVNERIVIGKSKEVESNLNLWKSALPNYNFLNWMDSKNSSAITYYNGREYTITTNLNLYAVWERKTGDV